MDFTGEIIRDVLKPPPAEDELDFKLDFWKNADGEDVCSLLSAADAASRSAFCQVPFAAWALTALDEEVSAVEYLLWYLDFVAVRLSNRLRRLPNIEEQMPESVHEASPPGRLVIASAVCRIRGGKAIGTNGDFVKQPLQRLFRQPFAGPVADALRILDLRFQRTYHSPGVYGEPAEFRTELSLLLGVTTSSPQSLAQSITEADLVLFQDAFVLEFMDPDREHKRLKELGNAWDRRCKDINECVTAKPELGCGFLEVARCLHQKRNFHASTAVATGLRSARHDGGPILQNLLQILSNGQANRDELHKGPALPALFPLLRELELLNQGIRLRKLSYNKFFELAALCVAGLHSFHTYQSTAGQESAGICKWIGSMVCIGYWPW